MSPAEIAEWHRFLVEEGSVPARVDYGAAGTKVRYDHVLKIVVETGAKGAESMLSLKDGQINRGVLTRASAKKKGQSPQLELTQIIDRWSNIKAKSRISAQAEFVPETSDTAHTDNPLLPIRPSVPEKSRRPTKS